MSGPPLPIVPGPWLPLTDAESTALINHLDTHLRAAGLSGPPFSRQCRLHELQAVPLSFYPGWVLVSGQADLKVDAVGTFEVLLGPQFIWCLDGKSRMIHYVNRGRREDDEPEDEAESPLVQLEPERTGPDYLRFFCHAVRGDQGAFRIVETLDDLRACGAAESAETHAAALKPLRLSWQEAASPPLLKAEATLLYGGALFSAEFEIDSMGAVTMVNDEPIAADLAPTELTQQWLRNVKSTTGEPRRPGAHD